MKRYIKFDEDITNGTILYRDGSVEHMTSSVVGNFFTTDLEYLRNNRDLGNVVSADRAKRYLLLPSARVWDPAKEFHFYSAESWANIVCSISDLEKFGVEIEEYCMDWNGNIDDTYARTSTDSLAYAGKQLGYDATIIRGVYRDGGCGSQFDEYAVYNPAVIKPF